MFRTKKNTRQIVETLAAVNVKGELVLDFCRLFKYKHKDVAIAVETVRNLYLTDQFTWVHLSETLCLVRSKGLRRKTGNFTKKARKGVWYEPGPAVEEAAKTRKMLLNYGFSESAITNCVIVLECPANCYSQALEKDVNFLPETITTSSLEYQDKCLNLLSYFAEKRMKDH